MRSFIALTTIGLVFSSAIRAFSQEPAATSPEHAASVINDLKAQNRILKAENERLKEALSAHGIVVGEAYGSAAQILKSLPAELQRASAWDKFSFEKVQSWLNTEPTGKNFEAILPVQLVKVSRNHQSQDLPWKAAVYLTEPSFSFGDKLFTQHLGEGWPQPLHLYGDEALAQKMENCKAGTRVRVSGKIQAIGLGAERRNKREMRIHLVDYELKFP